MRMNRALRRRLRQEARRQTKPGARPGTLVADPAANKPVIRVMAYGPEQLEERTLASVNELPAACTRAPVVWINVDGLGDANVIQQLGSLFNLHRLALEDVLHVGQRPKVESYGSYLFVVARMIAFHEQLEGEQLSIFLGDNFLLTFQELPGDNWDPVRARIRDGSGRLRRQGPDYLAYALLDATIDGYFQVLEHYATELEAIESSILTAIDPEALQHLHGVKRDLLLIRRWIWPMREMVHALIRDEHPLVRAEQRIYLRDCQDHTLQILDFLETHREVAASLMEAYRSQASFRLSEVMRVLTVISTIFMPLTFLVGVYGMNFHHMPELESRYGYFLVLIACAGTALLMLVVFRRKGWIGGAALTRERARRRALVVPDAPHHGAAS